ncbi:MAG: 16S rRNA (uracil(1498)-N(3))-methyltransferase [Armatimonadota bacterium]
MTRIFLGDRQIAGDTATVTGPDAHHLLTVLRMRPGDRFTVVDERGAEREATIVNGAPGVVTAHLGAPREQRVEPAAALTLYHGLPRSSRYETALRMCTEAGVTGFVPVLSARSVLRLSGEACARKQQRWARIVEEAAQQCGRTVIPRVAAPLPWRDALEHFVASGAAGVMPSATLARARVASLGAVVADLAEEGVMRLALFIGPEGGFDLQEEASAREAGIALVSMGPRILRSETAAIVAATICLERLGELGGPAQR